MSKLFNSYKLLKQKEPNKVYLFKSGMFYIALDEDSKKLSQEFGFKITKLNEEVSKCGFPVSRIEYYVNLLKKNDIGFEIIDGNYPKIENYKDYMNNDKLKKVVKDIQNLDLDNISFKKSYEILEALKLEINQIYGEAGS